MKKKQVIIVFTVFLITIALAITCGETYARYKLTRRYDTTFSSYPFYFEVKNNTDRIYVNRGVQTVNLNIKNYVEDNYNSFQTKYSITLEENDIFTLEQQITGTIEASKQDEDIELKLIPKGENTKTESSITLVIKTTEPYEKEVKIVVTIGMLGDYVKEIADSKTCNYNSGNYYLTSTDNKCTDSGAAEPPNNTYFWGTNKCLDFNYVWYSGYMWRITEILNDGSVKMISENILSAINFGQSAQFDESYIKQWLNEDFLDTLYNHEKILVENATWDISPRYDWCYIKPPNTTKAAVGLMNPYEFNKTAGYGSNSFLNLGHSWWLSSYSNIDPPYITVSGVQHDGSITGWDVPNTAFGVRPMVVLKADVKFSGEGTQTNPFVLLDDIEAAKEGDLINTRTPGELVQINDMLYRIVNIHEEDGKLVTKLKSANYIKDDNGSVMIKQFGSMEFTYDQNIGVSKTYDRIVKSNNDNYWLSYLNNEWLKKLEDQGIKKYLVEDTYYVKTVQNDYTLGSAIGSYKNAICENKDTAETTKNCKKTAQIWKGYVGLPIVGELFAYPLGGTDTHDYKTATMTPYGDGNSPMIGAFEPETQGIFQERYDNDFAVKPTITLSADVIIKSGNGKTPQTAYEIELP